jgi:hypothetical protein
LVQLEGLIRRWIAYETEDGVPLVRFGLGQLSKSALNYGNSLTRKLNCTVVDMLVCFYEGEVQKTFKVLVQPVADFPPLLLVRTLAVSEGNEKSKFELCSCVCL